MSGADTIFALSSGEGKAALAVVRVSGAQASRIITTLTRKALPSPRQLVVRMLWDPSRDEILDQGVVVWLPGPASFTGEDCAEFHVHGGRAVVQGLLRLLGDFDGVRLAEAGEFTRRAWANGKLDLVEVEGLADILAAQTAAQRLIAVQQLSGNSSSVYEGWRVELLNIRANLEAAVDFSDEDGVSESVEGRIDEAIRSIMSVMEEALRGSSRAEVIRTGVKVVLAGLPNTGKSSLLNVLASRDVAIVSPVAGTTRDVIEIALDLGGIPVLLTDTAGLRTETVDLIEAEGMRRSLLEVAAADVVVWVASADVPGSGDVLGDVVPDVVVVGKSDCACELSILDRNELLKAPVMSLSAKTGVGVAEFLVWLRSAVHERFGLVECPVVTTSRQRNITMDSIRYLNKALHHGSSRLELKAEEIGRAAEEIGRITGRTDVEEWLGVIFSRFCIGK